MTLVAGADVAKGQWVFVFLREGEFDSATVVDTLEGLSPSLAARRDRIANDPRITAYYAR